MNVKGETRVDYFHFLCGKCGEGLQVNLGRDGLVPTITAKCSKCGQSGTLKLSRTFPGE